MGLNLVTLELFNFFNIVSDVKIQDRLETGNLRLETRKTFAGAALKNVSLQDLTLSL